MKVIKGKLLKISTARIISTYNYKSNGCMILPTAKQKHGQFSVKLSTNANPKQNYLLHLYIMIAILPNGLLGLLM